MTKKKICMLGAFGVGKSSLVKRYLHGTFDERYYATLGARIEKQRVSVAGHDTTLMIWDFAGEDEIVDFPVSYVRGASGLIVVADGTRPDTLHTAINIHERACQQWGQIPTLIALNKHDRKERWEMDEGDLRELRRRCGPLMSTSAKSGHQARRIFETLAHRMVMADVSVA